MIRKGFFVAALWAGLQALPASGEVEVQDFLLENTEDLIELCGATANDPKAKEAIHFCHGYMVGLTQFHAVVDKVFEGHIYCTEGKKMPTRNESIAMMVKFHKANPQYKTEAPIDGVLRWARNKFPCPK